MASVQELESALVKADAAGDADAARAFAGEIRRMRSSEPSASRQTETPSYAANLAAAPEAALSLGTSALAAPLAGLAGIGQGALNLGRSAVNAVAPGTLGQGMPAGDRVRQVQEGLTYQPRTPLGQATAGAIAYPFEKIAEGADYVGGATATAAGSPALGAAVNTALQSAPSLIAKGLKAPAQGALARSQAEAAAAARRNSVRDSTIADAREAGYVLQPTEAARGGSFIENRLEGVGGKAALNQEVQLRNQEVTNRLARQESGLPVDEPISEGALAAARDRMAQPYREVSQLSPAARQHLEDLKEARLEAKDNWRYYDRSGDPRARREAQQHDSAANALEQQIEAIAQSQGRQGLVADLRAARRLIAKNHDVERALNVGSGDIDARVIGRMLDGRGVGGISDGLLTIGRFANAATRAVREGGPMPTPGKGEAAFGLMAGMGGHAAGMGWLPMGLPLLAGPARSMLLSPAMQTPRAYAPGSAVSGMEMLTRNPEAYGTIPALGAGDDQGLSRLLRR